MLTIYSNFRKGLICFLLSKISKCDSLCTERPRFVPSQFFSQIFTEYLQCAKHSAHMPLLHALGMKMEETETIGDGKMDKIDGDRGLFKGRSKGDKACDSLVGRVFCCNKATFCLWSWDRIIWGPVHPRIMPPLPPLDLKSYSELVPSLDLLSLIYNMVIRIMILTHTHTHSIKADEVGNQKS